MKLGRVVGVLACMLFVATKSDAAIIYTIDREIGAGSVTGFIETDGTLGILSTSNILDWSLILDEGNAEGPFTITGPDSGNNSQVLVQGDGLSATLTELLFDFSGVGDFVLFQNPIIGSGGNFWCVETAFANCSVPPPGAAIESVGRTAFGAFESAERAETVALGIASATSVPEPSTVALLCCALACTGIHLGGRRRSRRNKPGTRVP